MICIACKLEDHKLCKCEPDCDCECQSGVAERREAESEIVREYGSVENAIEYFKNISDEEDSE